MFTIIGFLIGIFSGYFIRVAMENHEIIELLSADEFCEGCDYHDCEDCQYREIDGEYDDDEEEYYE